MKPCWCLFVGIALLLAACSPPVPSLSSPATSTAPAAEPTLANAPDCPRSENLAADRVAVTEPDFCIVWVDDVPDEQGFRITLRYPTSSQPEEYVFRTGPNHTHFVVPPDDAPRLAESRQQFNHRFAWEVEVAAVRDQQYTLIGRVAQHAEAADYPRLPSATPDRSMPTPDVGLPYWESYTYELVDGDCSPEQCLFVSPQDRQAMAGVMTLQGYWSPREMEDFQSQVVSCDALVVQAGPPAFEEMVRARIARGNTTYGLDADDRVLVTLDLAALAEPERDLIRTSQADRPVALSVLLRLPFGAGWGVGTPPCQSPVQILSVAAP